MKEKNLRYDRLKEIYKLMLNPIYDDGRFGDYHNTTYKRVLNDFSRLKYGGNKRIHKLKMEKNG